MEIKISIITVCYNSEDTIKETIISVMNQSYKNIEYIIIDGNSTDNTKTIIEKYLRKFREIKFISEKDKGIYDAMNKGINISSGDYIFFLNSGDRFYKDDVIEKIFLNEDMINYDVIYGNSMDIYKNKVVERKYNDKINNRYFIRGNGVCHQVIFARRSTFDKNKFDLKYKICADKNWLVKSYKNGYKFKYIDMIISFYDRNGISSSIEATEIIKKETKSILINNYKILGLSKYFIKDISGYGKIFKFLVYYIKRNEKLKNLIKHIYIKNIFNKSRKNIKGKCNIIDYNYNSFLKKVEFCIKGNNNKIIIMDNCWLKNVKFIIKGNDNEIIIKSAVRFNRGGNIWVEDDKCYLEIGENTTFEDTHLAITENNSKMIIGKNCMFAYDIDIRTGDSHSIVDINNNRINRASNIIINDNVWVAAHSIVLKGINIPKDCVIATGSVVTKSFVQENSIIAGNPAKVVKKDIGWIRERI